VVGAGDQKREVQISTMKSKNSTTARTSSGAIPHTSQMSSEPDPNRMKTRASNSNAHPGQKALDALRVHRPQDAIQREKEGKKAKQVAKEKKRRSDERRKKNGKKYISTLEAQVIAEASKDKSEFPRHHVQTKRRPS